MRSVQLVKGVAGIRSTLVSRPVHGNLGETAFLDSSRTKAVSVNGTLVITMPSTYYERIDHAELHRGLSLPKREKGELGRDCNEYPPIQRMCVPYMTSC
jgi:hypothetical protein